jgi:hypothetical protein
MHTFGDVLWILGIIVVPAVVLISFGVWTVHGPFLQLNRGGDRYWEVAHRWWDDANRPGTVGRDTLVLQPPS